MNNKEVSLKPPTESKMHKFTFPLSIIVILFLGIVDHLTGYETEISIFYLVPILWVACSSKRSYAILACLLSATVWLTADLTAGYHYPNFMVLAWNMVMRLAIFLFIALLTCGFKKELERIKTLSRIDTLTGFSNSRYFTEQARIEIKRAIRFNRPISIAYMDIDNFKKVNDNFGHDRGDNLLSLVGKIIKDRVREYDIVGRLGGDEFAVLFPETNSDQAQAAINRIQQGFNAIITKDMDFISLSIGLITYNKSLPSIQEMIKTADNLMYTAKKSGKNKVKHQVIE